MLKIIHNLSVMLCFIGIFLIYTIVSAASYLFTRKNYYPQKLSKIVFKIFIFISGIRVNISGAENIPKTGGVVIASNHEGIIDGPVLLSAISRNFRFIALKMLFEYPIFGFDMKLRGDIPLDRANKESSKKTLEITAQIVKNGEAVLIFPEGIRSYDGSLGAFRSGALVIATKSGAPIIPVAISGSYHILPRHKLLLSPGLVSVMIGKPMYFSSDIDIWQNVEILRKTIAEMLKKSDVRF